MMKTPLQPGTCAVCGGHEWHVKYEGPIRHGTFGTSVEATVFECDSCHTGFLPSAVGLMPNYYAGAEYRELVGEGSDAESFFKLHDVEQLARYPLLERVSIRDRVVAEIGCAAGSFLDGVRGFAEKTLGVEPAVAYHESLRERGHMVFADLSEAVVDWSGTVDVAACFSVIEHVSEPVRFLQQICDLLSPGGQLLLSTPNTADILLEVGGQSYQQFFYRSVHSYYFAASSLRVASRAAGFTTFEPRYVQRYNFANFIDWLREQKPTGNAGASSLGPRFDRIWKAELEESGRSDYLYAWLGK